MNTRLKDNLSEQIFGQLRVVELVDVGHLSSRSHKQWKCICSCGNTVYLRTWQLKVEGRDKCSACNKKLNSNHHLYTGCGLVSGNLMSKWKAEAKRRQLDFQIDATYLWSLFQSQGGKCAITGIDITLPTVSNGPKTASIDRIDSTQGYIQGNLQWVHTRINFMKASMTTQEFLHWCRLAASANPVD